MKVHIRGNKAIRSLTREFIKDNDHIIQLIVGNYDSRTHRCFCKVYKLKGRLALRFYVISYIGVKPTRAEKQLSIYVKDRFDSEDENNPGMGYLVLQRRLFNNFDDYVKSRTMRTKSARAY